MSDKTTKMKTRCYYTDYVNHMIRFYLSTPEGLNLQDHDYSSCSVANWSAVQLVFRKISPQDADLVRNVFKRNHYLPKAVDDYCKETGADVDDIWRILSRINAKVARIRGLV